MPSRSWGAVLIPRLDRFGMVARVTERVACILEAIADQVRERCLEVELIREVGRDTHILGQEAELKTGGEPAAHHVIPQYHIGVKATAGRNVHDLDHAHGIEAKALAGQQSL